MTFEHMLNERERKGIERGRAEGHAAGLSEGHKAGVADGAAQEKREIAKNLKVLKLPIAQISEATGLPAAEIEAL